MARDDHDEFEYDVALSFAGEDRAVAEKFAGLLAAKNMSVFRDEYPTVTPAEGDLIIHIAELYRRRARYCVMMISQHYPLEQWTEVERTSAREHALRDANEYIIPVLLDDAEVQGITDSRGYMDLRQQSMENIADFLIQRFDETTGRSSGPPSRSHDLRSGNIPPKQHDP